MNKIIESKSKYSIRILPKFIGFVIIGIVANTVISEFFNYISGHEISKENPIVLLPLKAQILLAIIIGPLLETLIFQSYMISFFKKSFSSVSYTLPIFSSAALFGISHFFDIYSFINTFLIGLYFNYLYVYYLKSSSSKILAFALVFLLHSILNTVAVYTNL